MKIVKWTLDTAYGGAEYTGEFMVADDATDETIRETCREEAWNLLELRWEVE
ncbi:hypothetical protein [Desulfitobacterium hafniense]|uniref:hypothetical protein n=1 Tax=Desulfitobacterium hafniense TaxID=49338 RepID=UPI000369DDF4|nr:hypothetical protein [Desulfitobacterium hafniense]